MPMVRCLTVVSALRGTYQPGTVVELSEAEAAHLEKHGGVERLGKLSTSAPRALEPTPVAESPASHPTVYPAPTTSPEEGEAPAVDDGEHDTRPEKFQRRKR